MTAKVIRLHGQPLVDILEAQLAQARRGEIESMAFAAVMTNGTVCEGWTPQDEVVQMYGAINILRDAYFHRFIEHSAEAEVET